MLFLQQNWRTRRWNRFYPEVVGEEMSQIMNTRIHTYKNDKIKNLKKES
jgi:hypothetical protein